MKYFTGALGKIQEGEEVIGSVSVDLRRMYGVITQLKALVLEKTAALNVKASLPGFHANAEDHEVARQIDETSARIEVISELFWMCIREEVGHHTGSIGLRDDWDVVSIPSRAPIGLIADLLRM